MLAAIITTTRPAESTMTMRNVDYHYLRTTGTRGEPRKYASASEAKAAVHDLIELQAGRGFATTKDPAGKFESRHPDGRSLQFWIESERGDIVS
jgi:hypothetical protein